jgi:hypothetical protein
MRFLTTIAALCVAAPAVAAPTVGTAIKDTAGAPVGTVASVDGDNIIVDTGTNKVPVPEKSFTPTPDGLLLAMTKVQLDSAFESALAAQKAKVIAAAQPGATVRGSAGALIGTVARMDGDYVRIKGEQGEARIPLSGLALKDDGLHFGMTAAEFAEAVKSSTAAEPPKTSAANTATDAKASPPK